jgi:ribose transport system ATP-binding protein
MMAKKTASWSLRNVEKSFPGVRALKGVDIDLNPGQVHALVGENGCGKSTLIKTFAGVHKPDSGIITRDDDTVLFNSPADARSAGVATIFQEYSLVGGLTVEENISLGSYSHNRGVIDRKATRQRALDALELLSIQLDLDRQVGTLSVADQQIVEIAKAVSAESTLLILDEPTTALSIPEVERLHGLIRRIQEAGKAILYVSHRLEELFSVATAVTVMRDGEVAARYENEQPVLSEVVTAMVGRNIDQFYSSEKATPGKEVLRVSSIKTQSGVEDVSFRVHAGEIVGLAGVVGSGRTEIFRAIYGADPIESGSISLEGKSHKRRKIRDSIAEGIGFVPENRKTDALFFNLGSGENLSVAGLAKIKQKLFLDLKAERNTAGSLIKRFSISSHALETEVDKLSGGNQQKITLARWVFAGSQILLLDEPTQGIDVGAKQEVYKILSQLKREGIAIVMVSSDLPELLAMSDRLVIIREGRSEGEVSTSSTSEIELIQMMSSKNKSGEEAA